MNIDHQNHGDFRSSGSSDVTKSSNPPSRLSNFIGHVHSARTLYLISAVLQVTLGAGVIIGAVTGYIRPLWFSTLISMFGSVTCMVGLYLFFTVSTKGNSSEQLIRDAMRRIMNAQN